jgi:hypothetical protein
MKTLFERCEKYELLYSGCRKTSDMRAVVSNFPNLNIFENCETTQTKVKTSTLDCQDKEKSIKHFVNPKMTPAADMRKVGTDGDGAHLDQMN